MSSRARRTETKRAKLFGVYLYRKRLVAERDEKTIDDNQRFSYTPMRYVSQNEIDAHLDYIRTLVTGRIIDQIPIFCKKGNQSVEDVDIIRTPGFFRVEQRQTIEEYFFTAYPRGYPTHHNHTHMSGFYYWLRNLKKNSLLYAAYKERLKARIEWRKEFLYEESKKQFAISNLLLQRRREESAKANAFFQMIAVAGSIAKVKP